MTKKEAFIKTVEEWFNPNSGFLEAAEEDEMIKMAIEFFEEFKKEKTLIKTELTENGAKILRYMQENYEKYNNVFKAKEIGEGLFVSSRSVSGSMKKLVTEGFVDKIGSDPVAYSITDKGKEKDLSNI